MHLHQDFAAALPELVHPATPPHFPSLQQIYCNTDVATSLLLNPADLSADRLASLLENNYPAMAYAGHQFGHFSPRLGDGRALLLGELTKGEDVVDLHLKGSGPTVFARGGDGKMPVDAAWKEIIYSRALTGLKIPSSRILAAFTTGEMIKREQLVPGALIIRAASSHIRVGTFQYAATLGDNVVQTLCDYTIARHYPLARGPERYRDFFSSVVERQAQTVALWMRHGFVHGVMNTDNTTLSGESIDFGPAAFSDTYNDDACYSSIDTHGRYRYGYQPSILGWNLARLAECLVPLVGLEWAQETMATFGEVYYRQWLKYMGRALGISHLERSYLESTIEEFMELMKNDQLDRTLVLRALSEQRALPQVGDLVDSGAWASWMARWRKMDPNFAAMLKVNPVYIARNHLVAASSEDPRVRTLLLDVLGDPFRRRTGQDYAFLEQLAPRDFGPYHTVCGT
ncbi:protein adenylyltransferase SelO family protein [Corynebacterium sp. ES2794-CONJ1]|uniref:protein adenylyltransferase SelO family protein n=1 Tax=unclassified Corynebacterium TaxID=2624378 RepID=UPI002169A29C|nr:MULTISPECIES: protein adenylyltransferase SelO family protein [unclassified Corynebacterium]MCS4490927.1 protein adenylyltransferase SelO family protein [Corynebacterium sp. ES2715-CONJ3]MCS4531191.1 protein adenylyltransferase SelO family protein [Corynebacterium sp. ES2730-CONJ]MCU9518559.1 protein adenylyltransferase SelO family protein [Corynebacterium sp. ES2794-CONJ1]